MLYSTINSIIFPRGELTFEQYLSQNCYRQRLRDNGQQNLILYYHNGKKIKSSPLNTIILSIINTENNKISPNTKKLIYSPIQNIPFPSNSSFVLSTDITN